MFSTYPVEFVSFTPPADGLWLKGLTKLHFYAKTFLERFHKLRSKLSASTEDNGKCYTIQSYHFPQIQIEHNLPQQKKP